MAHDLESRFGGIPEALQEKDECIICKTAKAKEGYLACGPCIERESKK